MYKMKEVKQYARETIKERLAYDKEYLEQDLSEIHHDLFNTDYYLIYYSDCIKWLSNNVFNVIGQIKEYEESNFGEVTTDLSNSCNVVNMYVYILGEYIIYNTDLIEELKQMTKKIKINITNYNRFELSALVYNTESLYKIRFNEDRLKRIINELYIYNDEQYKALESDLIDEFSSNPEND